MRCTYYYFFYLTMFEVIILLTESLNFLADASQFWEELSWYLVQFKISWIYTKDPAWPATKLPHSIITHHHISHWMLADFLSAASFCKKILVSSVNTWLQLLFQWWLPKFNRCKFSEALKKGFSCAKSVIVSVWFLAFPPPTFFSVKGRRGWCSNRRLAMYSWVLLLAILKFQTFDTFCYDSLCA